jgi:cyclic nucleotide gated channel
MDRDGESNFLDAIHERLIHMTYIQGSRIFSQGGLIQKTVFVVRGKLESIGEDGIPVPLFEGDVCGEELLAWYIEQSSEIRGTTILDIMITSLKRGSNNQQCCLNKNNEKYV